MTDPSPLQTGFFRKLLLSFTPFPIIMNDFIHEYNAKGENSFFFLEEPDLPENFTEHFFPDSGFFYRDRMLVRSGLIVRGSENSSPEDFLNHFLKWAEIQRINQNRFRFIPCEKIEFTPFASRKPVFLILWFAEPTPFEKLLGKRISPRPGFLDATKEKAEEILNKKPWRRWRTFRYISSSTDNDEGFARIQLHITNAKFRAVFISIPDSSGENTPAFFERLSRADDVTSEHRSVLTVSNHSQMKSLSLELKKNGKFTILARDSVAIQYSASRKEWISLEGSTPDLPGVIFSKGSMKKGDRLILSSGKHHDEMNLLLDAFTKSEQDWVLDVRGGEGQGRALFLKRD